MPLSLVSQATGYFHWPPVWVVEEPINQETSSLNEVVFDTIMPSRIHVIVLRQGIFIFDFSNSTFGHIDPNIDLLESQDSITDAILQRINILNIHLVCLYSTYAIHEHHGISKMVITPSNIMSYTSLNHLESWGMNFDSDVLAKLEFMRASNDRFSDRKTRSIVISKEVVIQSLEMLEKVLQHPQKDTKDLINLYARSCKAYEDQEFGLSLSTSWTITEKLLFVFWNGYIDYLTINHLLDIKSMRKNMNLEAIQKNILPNW